MAKLKKASKARGKKAIMYGDHPHATRTNPLEIVEIEIYYGISLTGYTQQGEQDEDYSIETPASYMMNDQGVIVSINLDACSIVDITPILKIKSIEELNLTRNDIQNIEGVELLINLKSLYLGNNKINDISPLAECTNLRRLAIWANPIINPQIIYRLTCLESLYCQGVNLSEFKISNLPRTLREASFNKCRISNIDGIYNATDLGYLSISDNFIKDITPCCNLKALSSLDASNNLIEYIPISLAKNYNWLSESLSPTYSQELDEKIILYGNPLFYPPVSVLELGKDAVENYYDNAEVYGHAPLSEGRIIVIGDGSAGKSSLIERVLYDTFEKGKCQTNGIRIDNWELTHADDRRLEFHFWDFGGQEIQHAVHKFFFTEGCLYILVLDNRKEEEPEYWLQQIDSLGGQAPVMVVFNKHDDNSNEIADRKFLKEKYPNILDFYNISCKTGFGIKDFRNDLTNAAVKLRTVDEQFPNNWFAVKQAVAEQTSGEQHYIDYEYFKAVCAKNNVLSEDAQRLLLRYLTTIGAVTWFGDTYLNFLHILSPAWITQGVYKIITAKRTAKLYGSINISDFNDLLQPIVKDDYSYEREHYGYLLSMMKKFDLCYTNNDTDILIPSAFGKMPKVEYGDYRGEGVQTYILSFKEYMSLALIHRFIAKKIKDAFEGNFWYSGIVIQDERSGCLAMVHADKEAKRIYVRIKGISQLGVWEYIRREFSSIITSYASISYTEYVSLDPESAYLVSYEELIGHIRVNRPVYFHAGLGREFSVGQLMGMFESKEDTIGKFKAGEHKIENANHQEIMPSKTAPVIVQLLNYSDNRPVISVNTVVNINLQEVKKISSTVQGEANYLIEQLGATNRELVDALSKIIEFARDAKKSSGDDDLKEKGWGRKLKSLIETLSKSGDHIKKIKDGGEAIRTIANGINEIASRVDMHDVADAYHKLEHLAHQLTQ